jgi:hypothetical protein
MMQQACLIHKIGKAKRKNKLRQSGDRVGDLRKRPELNRLAKSCESLVGSTRLQRYSSRNTLPCDDVSVGISSVAAINLYLRAVMW